MTKNMQVRTIEINSNTIQYPFELFILIEIGKYAHELYNCSIDISSIELDTILEKCRFYSYFCYAITKKWLVNYSKKVQKVNSLSDNEVISHLPLFIDSEGELPTKSDYDSNYFYSYIDKKSMYVWVWELQAGNMEQRKIFDHDTSLCFLSLYAKYYLSHSLFGVPNYIRFIITQDILVNAFNAVYLFLLSSNKSKFYSNILDLDISALSERDIKALDYNSWKINNQDMGFTSKIYTLADKLAEMERLGIKENDFVSFYTKDNMGKIVNYNFAKVKSVDIFKNTVTFDIIHTMIPKMSYQLQYSKLKKEVKKFIDNNVNWQELQITKLTIDLYGLGVGGCYANEMYFMLPLNDTNDTSIIELKKGRFYITQNELLYWLLCDYNYSFDKKEFKGRYFEKGHKPLYELFLKGKLDSAVQFF